MEANSSYTFSVYISRSTFYLVCLFQQTNVQTLLMYIEWSVSIFLLFWKNGTTVNLFGKVKSCYGNILKTFNGQNIQFRRGQGRIIKKSCRDIYLLLLFKSKQHIQGVTV